MYLHGSAVMGCFNKEKSDIDLLVVVNDEISDEIKKQYMDMVVLLNKDASGKGIEMSIVRKVVCKPFVYPTPFELHFSNDYLERCKSNLEQYCIQMNGTDKDLAAHFTVTKKVGYALCGKGIDAVFGDVPKADYLDSIKYDIKEAQYEIFDNPIYYILNLCRVCAYENEDLILSKEQGGIWGLKKLPSVYAPVIDAAVKSYTNDREFQADNVLIKEFVEYMIK